MKVLQINIVYGSGSTGKIVRDLHHYLLEKKVESYVAYGFGKVSKEKSVYKVSSNFFCHVRKFFSRLSSKPYSFSCFTNFRLYCLIRRVRPDVIQLHCLNGYFIDVFRLLSFLKKAKIPTVLTLHAEFMYTGGCGYSLNCEKYKGSCVDCQLDEKSFGKRFYKTAILHQTQMIKAFSDFGSIQIVGVSEWISNRARHSSVFNNRDILTIHNGIDTHRVFYPRMAKNIASKYNIPLNKKIILSVVPSLNSDLKGGRILIDLAKDFDPQKYCFVIVGGGIIDYKSDNVLLIDYVSNQDELSEIYSLADVFVMASKIDNYPTVCLEANSCGVPIVGFDIGGVKETIYPGYGEVVHCGDLKLLKEKIILWAEKKKDPMLYKAIANRNSLERMGDEYLALYDKMKELK